MSDRIVELVFQNTTDEDSMVVQGILASRTVTRKKKNPENAGGAQESETKKPEEEKEEEKDEDSEGKEKVQDENDKAEKSEAEKNDAIKKEETTLVDESTEKPVVDIEKNGTEEPGEAGEEKDDENVEEVEEFYVKYRNFSHLHCEWKTEEELFKGDKRIAAKLKRFKQKMAHNTNIFENVRHQFCKFDFVALVR